MSDLSRLLELLIPHLPNESARRMLFILAFGSGHPLLAALDFSGAAHEFALRAVETLQRFGETAPGTQALWQLLLTLKGSVGLDVQQQIDALEHFANLPAARLASLNPDPAAPRVFISYSRADAPFARDLYQRLSAEDFRLWRDRSEMEAGKDWWAQIQTAIHESDTVILCLSPTALASPVVTKEWRYARQVGTHVIPVIAAPIDFTTAPHWVVKNDALDFRAEADEREMAWGRLLWGLRSPHERVRVPFTAPDLPEGFVQRPQAFDPLKALLLDAKRENPVAITTAMLERHSADVTGALALSDGRLLSWSWDHTLRLWDLHTYRQLAAFYGDAPITCCTLLADREIIAAGDSAGRVLFLRYVTGAT